MRYLLWQFRHMHTLHFKYTSTKEVYCPRCGAVYQKRKPMSTNRDDVTPTSKAPKPERSPLVFMTFVFLLCGAAAIIAGAAFGLPWVGLSGLFHGLTAIALAVLSLREKN